VTAWVTEFLLSPIPHPLLEKPLAFLADDEELTNYPPSSMKTSSRGFTMA
jgi:hypothetical protein